MGGLAGILGHVAGGFNEQANVEKQRQFEAEMQHRNEVSGMLQKLAFDETASPESRNAALNELGNVHNTPITKAYKFDPYKAGIIRNAQSRSTTTPGLSAPAPPPGGQQQPTFSAGAAGAPPTMSMPAPPPGLNQAMAGAGAGTVSTPSSASAFLSPAEVTQMMAARTGAVTGAQVTGAAKGREQIMTEIQQLPPDQQAMIMGNSAYLGMLYRSRLAGQKIPMSVADAANDPEVAHLLQASGIDPSSTGMVMVTHDKTGAAIKAEPYTPTALVPKTTTSSQSMDQAGGIHTSRTTGPAKGGGQPTAGQPSGGKTAGSPHVTSSSVTNWQDDSSPVAQAAKRWATQGQAPKGGAMAERQVLSYMKQHGLEPALPVPPAMQQKIQETFQMRNSAIGLIDDIQKNSQVLDSLISSGKIQTAINPSTGAALVTRAADLTDRESKVAGDFQQLVEHTNLLRGPLGATGFRGPEAWAALQAQRGNIMSDPRITRQALSGMRDRLLGLNSADKMVLTGHGMDMPEGTQMPGAPPATTPAKKQFYRMNGKFYDAQTHQEIPQ